MSFKIVSSCNEKMVAFKVFTIAVAALSLAIRVENAMGCPDMFQTGLLYRVTTAGESCSVRGGGL